MSSRFFLVHRGFWRCGRLSESPVMALIVYLTITIILVSSKTQFVTSSPYDAQDHD
jgi:hypothetical protein